MLLLAACGSPVREWPAGELRSGGRPVSAALGPEEVHRYRLPLEKGFLLRLVVDQQGIDAVVALEDPAGARVLEADRLIEDRGPELVLAVADQPGDYTLVIRGVEGGPGRYEARVEALRPASEADRRSAAAYRFFTGAASLEADEAMARRKQALATWRELGEADLEAEALERLAKQHMDRGEWQLAAARYREAAAAFARAGDRRREGIVRVGLGSALLNLDKIEDAAEQCTRAVLLVRGVGDRLNEARARHCLGQAFHRKGELQRALDQYSRTLTLWPQGNALQPQTLHQLGVLYARHLHDERRGQELLLAARQAFGPKQENEKARTSSQLGRISYEQERLDEARRYFEEALALRKERAPCTRAVILARLALVEERQGKRPAADARRAEALRLLGSSNCRRAEPATVHLLAGELAERRGDAAGARAHYHKSEEILAGLDDKLGVAESLKGIARNAYDLGDLPAARAANRRALDIYQGVRPTVLSDDLRTSFFAGARPAVDFQVALLLEMGAEEEAWANAEEARAQVLRDLLAEAGAGLRRDASPEQRSRERALWQQIKALEMLRSETKPEQLASLRQDIDARVADLEALLGEIRRRSPRYASLIQPEPVSLAAVRRDLLDDDTVLLEYRLGETASTVWAVTRDALAAVRLPPRGEIESAARNVRMQSLEGQSPRALCELSRMLLAPVAPFLGHRRLVVVADGALEALSFAALPMPAASCPESPLLVDAHEIVYLPSAATLLTQRRLLAGRQPEPGWLAVVADPFYRPGSVHRRLPGTAQEAKEIVAGLPADKVFRATGRDASRKTVTGGKLQGFRILHFAAHGLLDAEQPLLSALALSEVDPAGQPVQSELRAHEIYDLDLPAELVVLSACETALGRDVPGEGLVSGLPRAFLYAGAARVLVSLWEVDDLSTRDLMVRFYRGLFDRKLPPAQALQEAQRALRQAGRPPREWAGFVLLGDWRPLPPFSD